MAGLIDSQFQKKTSGGKFLYGYDPEITDVNKPTDTVQGQLTDILSQDSPLVTRARAGAAQTANQRGLLNSTMAAQAGEAAAIDSALPIATQDAQTYSTQRLANQDAKNSAFQFGAQGESTSQLQTEQAQQEAGLIGTRTEATSRLQAEQAGQTSTLQAERADQTMRLQEAEAASQKAIQVLQGDQAKVLAEIEQSFRTLVQSSDSASKFFISNMEAMAAIMAQQDTSPEAKQAGVDRMTQMLRDGLTVIGGIANVDIAGLLDFS